MRESGRLYVVDRSKIRFQFARRGAKKSRYPRRGIGQFFRSSCVRARFGSHGCFLSPGRSAPPLFAGVNAYRIRRDAIRFARRRSEESRLCSPDGGSVASKAIFRSRAAMTGRQRERSIRLLGKSLKATSCLARQQAQNTIVASSSGPIGPWQLPRSVQAFDFR